MVNFGSLQFKLYSCSSMPLLSYARCFKPSTLTKHAQAASHSHAAGKRTVGVKVNVDNTEIYLFP